MNEPNWQDVIRRLQRLENQNRLLRWFVGSIGVVTISFACLQDPVGRGVFDVVRAKEMRLEDSDGRVRGILGHRTYGADDRFSAVGLTLFGEDGREKLQLLADDTGSHSKLSLGEGFHVDSGFFDSADGGLNIGPVGDGLMISADGKTITAHIFKDHKLRAALSEDDEGTPVLVFFDASGRRRSPF